MTNHCSRSLMVHRHRRAPHVVPGAKHAPGDDHDHAPHVRGIVVLVGAWRSHERFWTPKAPAGYGGEVKATHPSYRQLLVAIPDIQRCFAVEFLAVPGEEFRLARFSTRVSADSPLLMIMAGCHGEEPAPPLAIFTRYRRIAKAAEKHRVNLVVYPLVNPWGFERNARLNREGLNCNSQWIHRNGERVANEVTVISRDLRRRKPFLFASLHEDDDVQEEFSLFSFGERAYERPLLKVGETYFPILRDGEYDGVCVKGGVAYDHHDGSAEDMLFHRGCAFSCCTETPSRQPLPTRVRCNTDVILKLIELSRTTPC